MFYMKTCSGRALLLITLLSFIAANGFSKSRTSLEALSLANSFCQKDQRPVANILSGKVAVRKLAYTGTGSIASRSSNVNPYYYVFDIGENNGFVIVSGDDRAKDILGYSDGGSFPTENIPENFKNWMAFYEKELKALAATSEDTTIVTPVKVSASTTLQAAGFATFINPLLGTIKWDQATPYNIFCPIIHAIQAPTGCVATAMAQVMKYHQWPVTGTGTKTYKASEVSDSLTADFSGTTYDWANMTNTYDGYSTAAQDTAVARLMYHCGVAVNMDYSPSSSGAYDNDIPAALSNYFGYDKNAQLYTRNYFSESEWINLIKTELNASRPLLYGGASLDGAGHQFVCDGYDSDNLFHFNWGWSGVCNGYFELSSLNVMTPGIGGGTGGFSIGQDMVIGVQKPTDTSVKTYQLYLMQKPEVNKTTIARDSIFSMTYGYANYGGNTFDGALALGLYQGNTLVSIFEESKGTIPSYYGDSNHIADSLSIPSSVSDGAYQIYSIYKATDQSDWSVMRNKVGTPHSLDVIVTSSEITFGTPDVYPGLTLTEPLKVTGNLYNGRTARMDATIQNTGGEYNSYLIFKLKSATDDKISQTLNFDIINIPAGATKTIKFTGNITLQPGDYILTLFYDSVNNQDNPSLTLLPGTNNSVAVSVINASTLAPALTLTEKMALVDSTILKGSEAVLTAKVKNTGGYFDNNLMAYIFTPTGGSAIGYLGPKNVILDTNEEKNITFNKEVDLEEGIYLLTLYFSDDAAGSNWHAFTPDLYGKISFTVTNTAGIEKSTTGKLKIYPNPAVDVFYVQSPSLIKSILILDLSGQQILKQEPMTAGTVSVKAGILSRGVYLIKIETEEGTYTKKLFKK